MSLNKLIKVEREREKTVIAWLLNEKICWIVVKFEVVCLSLLDFPLFNEQKQIKRTKQPTAANKARPIFI